MGVEEEVVEGVAGVACHVGLLENPANARFDGVFGDVQGAGDSRTTDALSAPRDDFALPLGEAQVRI